MLVNEDVTTTCLVLGEQQPRQRDRHPGPWKTAECSSWLEACRSSPLGTSVYCLRSCSDPSCSLALALGTLTRHHSTQKIIMVTTILKKIPYERCDKKRRETKMWDHGRQRMDWHFSWVFEWQRSDHNSARSLGLLPQSSRKINKEAT